MSTPARRLRFVSDRNPIQRINEEILTRLIAAQDNIIDHVFPSAADFYARVFDDLKLSLPIPDELAGKPVQDVSDQPFTELMQSFRPILRAAGITGQSARIHAVNLAQRTHLVRAFEQPDALLTHVEGASTASTAEARAWCVTRYQDGQLEGYVRSDGNVSPGWASVVDIEEDLEGALLHLLDVVQEGTEYGQRLANNYVDYLAALLIQTRMMKMGRVTEDARGRAAVLSPSRLVDMD